MNYEEEVQFLKLHDAVSSELEKPDCLVCVQTCSSIRGELGVSPHTPWDGAMWSIRNGDKPDIIGFTIDSLWHTAAAKSKGSNYSAGIRSLMCSKVDKIRLIEERFFRSINNPSYLPGSKTDKSFKEWVGIFKAIKELNR